MTQTMGCRASELVGLDDPYLAWCLDEAVAEIVAGFRAKRKLRPKHTGQGNEDLIERYLGKRG